MLVQDQRPQPAKATSQHRGGFGGSAPQNDEPTPSALSADTRPPRVRAVRLAAHPDSTPEQLDRSIQLRLERQQQVGDQQITAVINEAVTRRMVGGPAVVRAQLARLVEEIRSGRVELRMLPFEVGAHAAMTGSFTMLRFEDTEEMDLVYTENERGAMYLERPADLIRYGDVFRRAHDASLTPDETARRLVRLAEEL